VHAAVMGGAPLPWAHSGTKAKTIVETAGSGVANPYTCKRQPRFWGCESLPYTQTPRSLVLEAGESPRHSDAIIIY
jgi:hypothetical protein